MTGLLERALEAAPAPSSRLAALLFTSRRPSWVRSPAERSGLQVHMNVSPAPPEVRVVYVPVHGPGGGGMRA